jgi:quinol-cytochrome oxidoreductase complex cytochrome b subunit
MLLWTLVPWLDRKSRQNKKSPMFTIVGVVAILFFVVLTTIAYVEVGTEQEQGKVTAGKPTSALIIPATGDRL